MKNKEMWRIFLGDHARYSKLFVGYNHDIMRFLNRYSNKVPQNKTKTKTRNRRMSGYEKSLKDISDRE